MIQRHAHAALLELATGYLGRWSALAGREAAGLHLVFGGDKSCEREDMQVHSWRDV